MASPPSSTASLSTRIDKWLWAARFYKTRSLATTAIDAGHVRLNGVAPKPAREVRAGDTIDLQIGAQHWTVLVRAIASLRGPASEAQKLYQETEASVTRRAAQKEAQFLAPTPGSDRGERPTKRDRRHIHRFTGSF